MCMQFRITFITLNSFCTQRTTLHITMWENLSVLSGWVHSAQHQSFSDLRASNYILTRCDNGCWAVMSCIYVSCHNSGNFLEPSLRRCPSACRFPEVCTEFCHNNRKTICNPTGLAHTPHKLCKRSALPLTRRQEWLSSAPEWIVAAMAAGDCMGPACWQCGVTVSAMARHAASLFWSKPIVAHASCRYRASQRL